MEGIVKDKVGQSKIEVGNMEFEINTVMEKQAAELVDRNGLDESIERFAMLVARKGNGRARETLDLLMYWKEEAGREVVEQEPKYQSTMNDIGTPKIVPTKAKKPLDEKERFSFLVDKLGISYNNVFPDDQWLPIVDVHWIEGTGHINDRKVIFSKGMKRNTDEYIKFMKKHVFSQAEAIVPMHIKEIKGDKVFANPDIKKYMETHKEDLYFEADVVAKRPGWVEAFSTKHGKKVKVDRDYIKLVKERPGLWKFETMFVTKHLVIAKPVELIEEKKPEIIKVTVGVSQNNKTYIKIDEGEKGMFVPNRFFRRIINKPGVWNMSILSEEKDRFVVEPIALVGKVETTVKEEVKKAVRAVENKGGNNRPRTNRNGPLNPHPRNPYDNQPQPGFDVNVEDRLGELFKNGHLTL